MYDNKIWIESLVAYVNFSRYVYVYAYQSVNLVYRRGSQRESQALRIFAGCTKNTNTQLLHAETIIFLVQNHLQLHEDFNTTTKI